MTYTIVALGGGYGGLTALNQLLTDLPDNVKLILVDRMPYQGLKTEYYALAAGTVAEVDIRVQFPADPRLEIRHGEVTSIRLNEKRVMIADQDPLEYDILIIGLGCSDKYHNVPGAAQHTLGIQSLPAARQTYTALNNIAPYGQVSIVGGGLSGVELAAELREARPDLNIRIIDRGASVLSYTPARLQKFVRDWFERHDVAIVSNSSVTKIEPGIIYTENDEFVSDEIVWTAGVQPNPIVQQLDLAKDNSGRILLNSFHQIPHHPDVYVVGDCASLPFPPSAHLAEEQGKQIAAVISANLKGETPTLGPIKLKGVLGSLGKKSGFGVMGKRTVMLGRVPRLLKSGVLWIVKHQS